MASDNDAETIKNAIETKSDLSYVRVMDKKLSGGQDGDILFHDALFAEPFELLATTIFKDNGWLTQQMKTGKTFLKNYFHLVDMLLPRRSSGKYGAQSSLFEILFSPDQRKREDDSQPARLEEKYIPDDAKEYLFQQDSEFAGMNSLPQPYSELDYAVESRDAWASLVRTDGANKWLIVSKQELFLFLFANVIVHLKRDRNYWPLFGASKGRQTYKFYQQLVRDYALYFDRQQRLKTGDPTLLRKYLQILGEVWLRRNVICRQARLGELDLHFEIDHFDINRRRIHGRLSQAYADVRRHPGYEQPSVELLRCVRDFTHQVCKLERAQAKNMGQRGANTPFRRDDCGFFRDALFEFLTLGMLHGDKFEMFVDIWMEYISEKNLDCGDERAWKALVCRRWYVCVVLLDVFLFRTKKRLQGRLDSKQLVRVEALLLKVQKHFALDGRLVQTLTDPDLPTSCSQFMPHEEHGIFLSKHCKVPAPSYDRSERADLPQTMALAALSHDIEQEALAGGDLDSARTLFTWFGDEGHANGGLAGQIVGTYGGQYDYLAPENLKAYWKDPESLPRMCIQRIDQEIDSQRTTKKKRGDTATLGFARSALNGAIEFAADTANALLAALNFAQKKPKTTVHDELKTQWKVMFDYDSTPQTPTIKAWCAFVSPSDSDDQLDSGLGKISFEQSTIEGNEVVPLDHGRSERLRGADGQAALPKLVPKANCQVSLQLEDATEWVDAKVASAPRSDGPVTVAWRKVTVTAKYDFGGLSQIPHIVRIVGKDGPIFEAELESVDAFGRTHGTLETTQLRLEADASPKAPPDIVGLSMELVADDPVSDQVVVSSGIVMNTFESQAGYSEVIALMHSMDGQEPGNRQYFENRSMLGPAREALSLSPALTDVEQDGQATAQVRATLLAFNRAWSGNGGQLDGQGLQVCFRILMQATGVRVHQLFELHTTPNFERGRDRRCWKSKSQTRGVAFTAKVTEALLEPKSLSTEPEWDLPLRQLLQKRRSKVPFKNVASLAIFLVPFVVFLLHAYVFDSSLAFSGRAIGDPYSHSNQSVACCNSWGLGHLSAAHIGNASAISSISECCVACNDFSMPDLPVCTAAIWDEGNSNCYFYNVDESAISDGFGGAAGPGSHMRWLVTPRSAVSRARDWLVHRILGPLSILLVLGIWAWALGPADCRLRRGRTGPNGRLPARLSCLRCWGISVREAMNLIPPTTLFVDEEYVDEALVQLLEEAEERKRWPLTFLVLPPKSPAAIAESVSTPNAAALSATVDSATHFATVFEEAVTANHLRFVGTAALEPLSQWEIPILTELLILIVLTIDNGLDGTTDSGTSLKDRGYDDGISYASGRRFAETLWDASLSTSTSRRPLRNVHWFLGGLRALGDLRNLIVVWFVVVPTLEYLTGLQYVSWAFLMLVGCILAGPSLIKAIGEGTQSALLTSVAWFVPPAIVAVTCPPMFLRVAGALLIATKFRPWLLAAASFVAVVLMVGPLLELVSSWSIPVPPAAGIDVGKAGVLGSIASGIAVGQQQAPVWAMQTGSLSVTDESQAEWLRTHAVEFVPMFDVFPNHSVLLHTADTPCVVSELSSPSSCTVNDLSSTLQVIASRSGPSDSIALDGCGDCFGAAATDGQCCNTCEELLAAYSAKGWDTSSVTGTLSPQCRKATYMSENSAVDSASHSRGSVPAQQVSFILGWNEPYTARGDTTLDPQSAARIWAQLVQPSAEAAGLSIVSPTTGPREDQVAWMGEFLKACFLDASEDARTHSCSSNTATGDDNSCPSKACDVSKISAWAIHDHGWEDELAKRAFAPEGAASYWHETYGQEHDGDFQRALAGYVSGALPCTADAPSQCFDWSGFVASKPLWFTSLRVDDEASREAINDIPQIERVVWPVEGQ